MTEGLSPEESAEAINQSGREFAQRVIADLCNKMLTSAVESMANYLREDQETRELYHLSGSPLHPPANVHVFPSDREAVLHGLGESQELLEMWLRPNQFAPPEDHGRLRVMIPMPEGYHYPMPLDRTYVPEEIYIEFNPEPDTSRTSSRYIVTSQNIRPYKLTEAGERVEQDIFSPEAFVRALAQRISPSFGTISDIYEQFYNYTVVEERPINILLERGPEENPTNS